MAVFCVVSDSDCRRSVVVTGQTLVLRDRAANGSVALGRPWTRTVKDSLLRSLSSSSSSSSSSLKLLPSVGVCATEKRAHRQNRPECGCECECGRECGRCCQSCAGGYHSAAVLPVLLTLSGLASACVFPRSVVVVVPMLLTRFGSRCQWRPSVRCSRCVTHSWRLAACCWSRRTRDVLLLLLLLLLLLVLEGGLVRCVCYVYC